MRACPRVNGREVLVCGPGLLAQCGVWCRGCGGRAGRGSGAVGGRWQVGGIEGGVLRVE